MKKLRRGLLALAAAGAAAFLLSGCYVITTDTPSQSDVIGDAVVHTETCISAGSAPCTDRGNVGFSVGGPTHAQLLIAYRVPDGVTAPDSFQSTTGTQQMTMSKSQSYTDALQSVVPAAAGEHWVGYLSQDVDVNPNDSYVFDTHFQLPSGGAVPFTGPFKYLTVVGIRDATSLDPADRPVSCGTTFADLTHGVNEGHGITSLCVDSPHVADTTNGPLPDDTSLATRDLAVAGGTTTTTTRNTTVNVPFNLDYAGTDPGVPFTLTAGITGLKDATAQVPSSYQPTGTGDPVQNVAVQVPVNAAPGSYPVTLTATLPNGQKRDGAALLVVTPDTKGPGVTTVTPKARLGQAVTGFSTTLSCTEDCSIIATLKSNLGSLRDIRRAHASKLVRLGHNVHLKLPAAGKSVLNMKLGPISKRTLKLLAKERGKLKARLTIIATDGVGNHTKTVQDLTFR